MSNPTDPAYGAPDGYRHTHNGVPDMPPPAMNPPATPQSATPQPDTSRVAAGGAGWLPPAADPPGAWYGAATAGDPPAGWVPLHDRHAVTGADIAPEADPAPPGLGGDTTTGPADDEYAIVLGEGGTLALTSGTVVRVRPLATREILSALRVCFNGLGADAFGKLDPDQPTEALVGQVVGMMLTGMLHAEDDMAAFIREVIEPAGLVHAGWRDNAVRDRNKAMIAALTAELSVMDAEGNMRINPRPEDTIRILWAVGSNEGPRLKELGKLVAWIVRTARRSGQIQRFLTSPVSNASAG